MGYRIISGEKLEQIHKKIKEDKDQKIIFTSNNDEINRKVLEKEKIDILLLNQRERKDFSKQRNSGLNHVLARIAKKNNIPIGINLDEIIEARNTKRAEILARVIQNIRICNKQKLKMSFIVLDKKNQRDDYGLKALGLILGMPTWMTKSINTKNIF